MEDRSKSLYSEFHQNIKSGQGICNIIHGDAGSKKPAVEAVVRFPFKIITDDGEVIEPGCLMKFSFWARKSKAGNTWYSGGVSAVGERFCPGGSFQEKRNTAGNTK